MITRYDPIQRLPIGGKTIGTMEACCDGEWVSHQEHAKLVNQLVSALVRAKQWMDYGERSFDLTPHDLEVREHTIEEINNAIKKATE